MIGLYHYIALGLFAGFAALELVLAGRKFPPITHWRLQGAAFTLLYFAVATYAPLFWDGWLGEHRLFAADTLPLWAQILGGFLVPDDLAQAAEDLGKLRMILAQFLELRHGVTPR